MALNKNDCRSINLIVNNIVWDINEAIKYDNLVNESNRTRKNTIKKIINNNINLNNKGGEDVK